MGPFSLENLFCKSFIKRCERNTRQLIKVVLKLKFCWRIIYQANSVSGSVVDLVRLLFSSLGKNVKYFIRMVFLLLQTFQIATNHSNCNFFTVHFNIKH